MIEIIIPANTNATQLLLDGNNVIDKIDIKRLWIEAKPNERTTVHLDVYVDRIKLSPAVLKLHGIEFPEGILVEDTDKRRKNDLF